ncbi:toxic anion resistance protein, partial [Acidithiobacillus thiooxidans]
MNALTPINSNQTAGISLGIPATATSILTDDDLQKVEALAAQIDLSSPTAASGFGKEIYTESGEMTDALLQRIRSSDTDVIGSRLNEVLQLARETNSNIDFTPKNTRERLYKVIVTTPVIGTLAKRMTRTVRSQIDRYESAAHQIDSVVAELDSAFDTIEQTNQLLDQNFAEVVERNRILEIHIQAGHRALAAYQ